MNVIDFRVYVITTRLPHLGRDHAHIAEAAVHAGAKVIQFRDKQMSDRDFAETALRLRAIAHRGGALFIVNDRVQIAVSVAADGVHVGRNDADVRGLRGSLPPGMILGASATDYEESLKMSIAGADYLGVGPVFPTGSKDDATAPIGINELSRICRDVRTPVVAIGGISQKNLPDIINTGAAGAAVISAVAAAPSMTLATTALVLLWEQARSTTA